MMTKGVHVTDQKVIRDVTICKSRDQPKSNNVTFLKSRDQSKRNKYCNCYFRKLHSRY